MQISTNNGVDLLCFGGMFAGSGPVAPLDAPPGSYPGGTDVVVTYFGGTYNDQGMSCQQQAGDPSSVKVDYVYLYTYSAGTCPPGSQAQADGQCQFPELSSKLETKANLGCGCGDTTISSRTRSAGDPIDYGTGNKYARVVDYRGNGPFPLHLTRYYNSLAPQTNSFGSWRGPYSRSISPPSSGVVEVTRDDGQVLTFSLINGVWTANASVNSKLVQTANGWTYTTSHDETETYDSNGRLTAFVNRAGLAQAFTYDGNGNLASATDPFGRQLQFAYIPAASGPGYVVSQVTVPDGSVYAYGYDTNNNLVSVTHPDNGVLQYLYENGSFPHALTGVIDENGDRYETTAYDSTGRAVSTHLAGGVDSYAVDYSNFDSGYVTVTNPLGAAYTYFLLGINGMAAQYSVARACGDCTGINNTGETTFRDPNGNVIRRRDYRHHATTYTYDQSRNLETSRTDATNRTIHTTWDATYRLPTKIAEPNRATTFTYDSHGNLLQKSVVGYTLTRTWTYTYNDNGQVLTADGPRADVSDVTSFGYDGHGNLTTITNALDQVTRITSYDPNGRPLTIQDPNGLVTALAYNFRGQVTSRAVGSELTTYNYDSVGDLVKVTRPDGSFLSFSYDAAHRLTGVTDALGDHLSYTLDATGNRTKSQQFNSGNTLTESAAQAFDGLGFLEQRSDAYGNATIYTYDGNGNRVTVTDPLGHSTSNGYDLLNRLTDVVKRSCAGCSISQTFSFIYDNNLHLSGVYDGKHSFTGYYYDGLDDRTRVVSPDSGQTNKTFGPAGNVLMRTDANGNTSTYTYDALNRVTGVSYADGSTAAYTYDTGPNGIGRLSSVSDSTGTTNWSYDLHGRVTEKQQTVGSLTLTTQYSYDSYGRRTEMIYPSGNKIDYVYDADGRISAVTVNGKPLITGIAYRPFGPVNAWTWGNGTPYSRQYDLDGRLTSLTMPISTRTVSYDAASRLTGLSGTNLDMTFGYDEIDRLAQVTGGPQAQSFQYDPNGNRTKLTEGSAVTSYSYNHNRLSSQSGASAKTYTYDADGSMTGDGTHTYSYDARNRLVGVDNGASTYAINDLGQRVSKGATVANPLGDANGDGTVDSTDFDLEVSVILQQATATGNTDCNRDNQVNVQDLVCINEAIANGGTQTSVSTYFSYDEQGRLIGEYDSHGNSLEETVYLKGMPIATIQSHTVYYVYPDQLGTPRAVTDTANVTLWRWDSAPFGETVPNEDPDGDGNKFTYNLRFPGQYYDEETGWHYNYYRYYDPKTGRYITSDPIGLNSGLNTYSYVLSNPVNRQDTFGLDSGNYMVRGLTGLNVNQLPKTAQEARAMFEPHYNFSSRQLNNAISTVGTITAVGAICASSPASEVFGTISYGTDLYAAYNATRHGASTGEALGEVTPSVAALMKHEKAAVILSTINTLRAWAGPKWKNVESH